MGSSSRIKIFLVYLGNASYSIYLIHFLTLLLLSIILKRAGVVNAIGYFVPVTLSIGMTITLSCVAHNLIERPLILSWRRKFQILGKD